MKKTILTVMCVTLVAAFAAGCASNLPGMPGTANDSESVPTVDKNAVIEVPAVMDDDQMVFPSEDTYNTESENNNEAPSNSNGYRDEDLLAWASKYYEFASGKKAPNVEIDHVDGDLVHIHIFENIDPAKEGESDPGHRTTLEWYIVSRKTGLGKNFAGEDIDLTSMYKRTTGNEEAAG